MKLGVTLLANALASRGQTEDELNTIIAAHRMIRNGPLTADQAQKLADVERYSLDAVKNFDSSRSDVDAEAIATAARDIVKFGYIKDDCDSEYPSIDGKCNHPSGAGQPLQPYARWLPADYCNGRDSIRCSVDGKPLPNPRDVSVYLRNKFDPADRPNKKTSHFLNVAGQYITHTVLKTPDRTTSNVTCGCESDDNCVNWSTAYDAIFTDQECNFVTRSVATVINRDGRPVLEQINQLTGTFEAGVIYGFSQHHLNALRLPGTPFIDGNDRNIGGDVLPRTTTINERDASFANITKAFELKPGHNERGYPSFVSGDNRAFENPFLGSFHVLFHRFHNVLAKQIQDVLGADSDPEFIFNETRKINIAVQQKMLYEEMIPASFGESLVKFDGGSLASPSDKPIYQDENREEGPKVFNEFVTAGFRIAHSEQPEVVVAADPSYSITSRLDLKDNFFDPHLMMMEGPGAVCRGAAAFQSLSSGPSFSDSVANQLLKPHTASFGQDLFAINIARGRDHGIAGYKAYVDLFKADPECAALYEDWKGMLPHWRKLIKQQYRNKEEDVDLYVGMLMEQHLEGASTGPTGSCVQLKQFKHSKTQDRWFYENHDFWNNDAKFDQIKKFDVATVMCYVLENMETVPDMPFLAEGSKILGKSRKMVECSKLLENVNLAQLYVPNFDTYSENIVETIVQALENVDAKNRAKNEKQLRNQIKRFSWLQQNVKTVGCHNPAGDASLDILEFKNSVFEACDTMWYYKTNMVAFHNNYVCLDDAPRRNANHFQRHFRLATKMFNRIAKKLNCDPKY